MVTVLKRLHAPYVILAAIVSLLALHRQAAHAEIRGTVVRVHDGDTVTLLTPTQQQVKIRLQGVDSPEFGQPYGSAAKKSLAELVFGREVRLHEAGLDKYGRTLGHLYAGDLWVNREQVVRGMAWHYVQYSDDALLAQAEEAARRGRRGLWQDKSPVPPWQWRRLPRKKNG